MGERFLAFGTLAALASAISYFTKLNKFSILQSLHHEMLAVMILGTLLAMWGGLLLRKFERDER
jgi:hypothetical protein